MDINVTLNELEHKLIHDVLVEKWNSFEPFNEDQKKILETLCGKMMMNHPEDS